MARAIHAGLMLLAAVSAAAGADQAEYSYKVPPRAAVFAPLKAYLNADARATRVKFDRDVAAARIDARKNDYPFNAWSATREWKIVAETPRFLSLSLDGWDYTGGAHGNPWFGALVYDKATRQRLKPVDLFIAPVRLSALVRNDFCRLLDKERAKRRGEPVDRKAMFGECIDPAEQTVILGSRSGRAIDRIGFLIGPYAAGPYAEGAYEVTLPVTPAIIAQVKPAYRGAFAAFR